MLYRVGFSALAVVGMVVVGLLVYMVAPEPAECLTQMLSVRFSASSAYPLLEHLQAESSVDELSIPLRTDLKGTRIRIALPENAPDMRFDDILLQRFEDQTGIHVEAVRPGNDTTAVLSTYLSDLRSGSPSADVYSIDIVWPGMLSDFAEDLKHSFGAAPGIASTLVENNTINGKLVAIPYFMEISVLYYRTDLLQKYGFHKPPATWDELESQARMIQEGERKIGHRQFWGYLWQGSASEALTCNALEWQESEGGHGLLDADGSISIEALRTAAAWERAHRWIGTISPPEVVNQLEDDSLRLWTNGDAAFMRNWPYAYRESQRESSKVGGKVGVAILPRSRVAGGRHADVVGGFQLMVSNRSAHKDAAIELVRFMTSPQVQRFNAINRGYAPTRQDLYEDPAVLKSNPLFVSLRDALINGAITRPSTAAGSRYGALSTAYFSAVRRTLIGQATAPAAVAELTKKLKLILSN
jgi:trehalose/maltose transport system substrate-binding protein